MSERSNKHGPMLDDELAHEEEPLERSGRESHSEEVREQESDTGHRVAGSGSSAHDYTYKDHGEEGGASHPKPKDEKRDSGESK
jgi:hypothetical protein